MSAAQEFTDELRQRAVRMVLEARADTGGQPEVIKRVADELGVPPKLLWQWVALLGQQRSRAGS